MANAHLLNSIKKQYVIGGNSKVVSYLDDNCYVTTPDGSGSISFDPNYVYSIPFVDYMAYIKNNNVEHWVNFFTSERVKHPVYLHRLGYYVGHDQILSGLVPLSLSLIGKSRTCEHNLISVGTVLRNYTQNTQNNTQSKYSRLVYFSDSNNVTVIDKPNSDYSINELFTQDLDVFKQSNFSVFGRITETVNGSQTLGLIISESPIILHPSQDGDDGLLIELAIVQPDKTIKLHPIKFRVHTKGLIYITPFDLSKFDGFNLTDMLITNCFNGIGSAKLRRYNHSQYVSDYVLGWVNNASLANQFTTNSIRTIDYQVMFNNIPLGINWVDVLKEVVLNDNDRQFATTGTFDVKKSPLLWEAIKKHRSLFTGRMCYTQFNRFQLVDFHDGGIVSFIRMDNRDFEFFDDQSDFTLVDSFSDKNNPTLYSKFVDAIKVIVGDSYFQFNPYDSIVGPRFFPTPSNAIKIENVNNRLLMRFEQHNMLTFFDHEFEDYIPGNEVGQPDDVMIHIKWKVSFHTYTTNERYYCINHGVWLNEYITSDILDHLFNDGTMRLYSGYTTHVPCFNQCSVINNVANVSLTVNTDVESETIMIKNPNVKTLQTQSYLNDNVQLEVVTTDDIDKLIDADKFTQDYLFSELLTNDLDNITSIFDKVNSEASVNPIKTIYNSIDNDDSLTPTQKDNAKSVIEGILDTEKVKSIKFKTDNLLTARSLDIERFQLYRSMILNYSKESGFTSIIGHNRILMTNMSESPIYPALSETFSDNEIYLYSSSFKHIFDATLKIDSNILIDSMDMVNEVTLLQSSLTDLLKPLQPMLNKISQLTDSQLKQLESDEVKSLISDFENASVSVAETIKNTIPEVENTINMINNEDPNSFDNQLLIRNRNNVNMYKIDFCEALMSDPFNAIGQHNNYIRSRMAKISNIGIFNKMLLGLENVLIQLPNFTISVGNFIGNVVLTMIDVAIKGALKSVTIIDNIDKIVYISERYISKNIKSISKLPTYIDEAFTPPVGFEDQYNNIPRRLQIDTDVSYDITTPTSSFLKQYNDDNLYMGKYKYNGYNVSDLYIDAPGIFLSPISSGDIQLPILLINNDRITLSPNLTNFSLKYPERGYLWKEALSQYLPSNSSEIDKLTLFTPISNDIIIMYSGLIATMAIASGLVASMSAGLRGDWIGAIAGAAIATAIVSSANGIELGGIIANRTKLGANKSVYEYYANNVDHIRSQWNSILTEDYIAKNYVLNISNEDAHPLFSYASKPKQIMMVIKESFFLVGNIAIMFAVSKGIGSITHKLSEKVRAKVVRRKLIKQGKREKLLYAKERDNTINGIDREIENVQNDPTLSDEQKSELISKLSSDKDDIIKFYDGKISLTPSSKNAVSKFMAGSYGYPDFVASSSGEAAKIVSGIGPLTAKTLSDITTKVDGFRDKLDESQLSGVDKGETDDSMSEDISNDLTGLIDASSSLMKLLTDVKNDTTTIKKYT